MRNVNFVTGIVNGKKGVVRAVSPRIFDVEVVAPDFPLIKISRTLFEVKLGSKGITFHRSNFPYYAFATQLPSTKAKVKLCLDLRDDVSCHGQLYVALSRTTCSANIMCLVRPERLIDGVPHVGNCVFVPFITAATRLGLAKFSPLFYRPPLLPYDVTSTQLPPSPRHPPDNGWNIVDEVGDGACLLRTIARRVFGNPELHPQVRTEIVSNIAQTSLLCTYPAGSGTNQSTSLGAPHALTTTCKTTSKVCHIQTRTPATSKLLLQYNYTTLP